MIITRLCYLALLIGTGLFAILYTDTLSILLLLVVIILPIILFLLLLATRLLVKIQIELDDTITTIGTPVPIKLKIRNFSIFPLPNATARVSYVNEFTGLKEKNEISFPINAASIQTAFLDISSKYSGIINLKIHSIVIFDYFRLFSLKLKQEKEAKLTFLPDTFPINAQLRQNVLTDEESNVFSKTKKGDDPSEIFAIRDYVGGDKLNRIHWKLSSKQDTLMVKDFSLPINNNIVILLELGTPNENNRFELLDSIMRTTMSLSQTLCDAEIEHKICWYDCKTSQLIEKNVKIPEDMYDAIGSVLHSKIADTPETFKLWSDSHIRSSRIVYITAFDNMLDFGLYNSYITMINITDGEEYTPLETTRNVHIIPTRYDIVPDSLAELEI